jgi:hypothetical protein
MKKKGREKRNQHQKQLRCNFHPDFGGDNKKKAINKTYNNVESVPLNTKRPDTFLEHELNAFSALEREDV